jgi:Mg-chelatase subunit ChlD
MLVKNFKAPSSYNAQIISVFLCLLLTCIQSISAQETKARSVDWVFVLDTSASMVGIGGSKNIFSDVQRTLEDFIGKTQDGDTVTLYTFDSDTNTERGTRLITSNQDRNKLVDDIKKLVANGTRTHTGKALKDALDLAANLRKRSAATERTVSIVLLSDGREDTRGLNNPVQIPDTIKLIPEDPPYLFYVSLGEYEPGIKQVQAKFGERYREMRPNSRAEIDSAINEIRRFSIAPPPPEIEVTPASLDFGRIEPGTLTAVRTINITSNQKTRVRIALDADGLTLTAPDEVDLDAPQAATVNVQLASAPDVKDKTFDAVLKVTPINPHAGPSPKTASVSIRLQTVYVPIWRKMLKWIALLFLLLIVGLGVLTIVKGETPWALWSRARADKNLEGELELINPRPSQPEGEFVSLLQRGTERISISSLIPNGASDGADAELIALRKNKRKTIQLRRTQGSTRVNNVEVASTELFDGDVIELGAARLRFNWLGHQRPDDVDESESM